MRRLSHTVAALLAASATGSDALAIYKRQAWQVGQPVVTTSGTMVGHPAPFRPSVSEYLGVPFAKPPVGALRWAAPEKLVSNSTVVASFFGPDCPANVVQPGGNLPIDRLAGPNSILLLGELGQIGNTLSEDCLHLNVWTQPQTGDAAKAVVLFIHGGGFQIGSTRNPQMNGQFLAGEEDVVVVSINYRKNVFGFPGLPGLSGVPQNSGLLDQRLAIEWVRDNIAHFGGDPNRITLVGQSAGGASIDYYSFAFKNDPIAHAMIAQSGAATSFTNPAAHDNIDHWFTMSASLGCGDQSVGAQASLDCLRQKSWQDIEASIRIADPLKSLVLGGFKPTVDNHLVFGDYPQRGAQGRFAKKPFLTGIVDNEAGLFRVMGWLGGEGTEYNITDLQWKLLNLGVFNCPQARAARARADNGVDTYRYRYFGEFPNLRLTVNPPSGAWHGSEVPIIWKTAALASQAPNIAAENTIQENMATLWTNFAKNPQTAFVANQKYNPRKKTLIEFAKNNQTEPTLGLPLRYDLLCPAMEAIAAAIQPTQLPEFILFGLGNLTLSRFFSQSELATLMDNSTVSLDSTLSLESSA